LLVIGIIALVNLRGHDGSVVPGTVSPTILEPSL
jgi:hypothetical protein